jgi:hypothetical protein
VVSGAGNQSKSPHVPSAANHYQNKQMSMVSSEQAGGTNNIENTTNKLRPKQYTFIIKSKEAL